MNKLSLTFIAVLLLVTVSCERKTATQSRDNSAKTSPTVEAKNEDEAIVSKELIEQFIVDLNANDNNFRLSDEDLKVLNEHLTVERHDLNNDGIAEVFLIIKHHDWCGAGSNCTYWIYQQTKNGYELLMEDKVIGVLDTTTNGYRDLLSEVKFGMCKDANNNTAFNLSITPYKYDGKKYQPQKPKNECRKFTDKAKN